MAGNQEGDGQDMICHCDACQYTFNADLFHSKYDIPRRCPDCGKKTVGNKVPAVRAATEKEIEEYREDQRMVMEEMYEELNGRCG
ncbi:MAG: hypothetical protein LUH14_05910 [Clostridiaceae bacterium]|nr:hypothetical protein [Clostridiaceae bacterium]